MQWNCLAPAFLISDLDCFFFLLGAMVLVNCYSGIVISSLTVPKMKASIDSLEDLANSQEVDVLLRSDVSTGEQILVIHFAYSFVLST